MTKRKLNAEEIEAMRPRLIEGAKAAGYSVIDDEINRLCDMALSPAPASNGEAVVETLKWYGEQARLCRLIHSEGDPGRQALSNDGGKRAAAALAAIKPEKEGE